MESVCACRVLLVEDDRAVAQFVKNALGWRGFLVHHAADLASAQATIEAHDVDVVVLDLTLPDGDGFDFAAGLKNSRADLFVLALAEHDARGHRVLRRRLGVDGYLRKPIDMADLTGRLLARLRKRHPGVRHVIAYADLALDFLMRSVRRGDVDAPLSVRETELLAYLIYHKETPLSREMILRDVWGHRTEDNSNVLNVYINYLRNKIDFRADARLIHTVRGVGYMLSRHVPADEAPPRR